MMTTQFTIRLPDDLHAALLRKAETESRSLNGQIVYLLRKALAADPPPAAPPDR